MDPFAQMHAQMNAQMRRMQQEMMTGMPMGDPFMPQGRGAQRTRDAVGGVQIEEVDDERPTEASRNQPIVEEPDDPQQAAAARQHHQQRQREAQMRAQQQHQQRQERSHPRHDMQMNPFGFPTGGLFGQMMNFPSFPMLGSSGATTSYSFSSSSYSSSGGPDGVTYQETKTSRRGPGGVLEESHTVRDGRTGEEKMQLTRGLGERQRTLEQKRLHGEQLQRTEHLHGFQTPEEAHQFDSEWQSRAAGSLMPGFGDLNGQRSRVHAPRLGLESPAAVNGPIEGLDVPRRVRSRPHPHDQLRGGPQYQDRYRDHGFQDI